MESIYKTGNLDPSSTVGRGTIIEYVVMETLKDCIKKKAVYKYDLDSDALGEVNVKSSRLNTSNAWNFNIKPFEYKPDCYVCVALDNLYTKILHVWMFPPEDIITKRIIIPNSENGLNRVKDYEVDPSEYDSILQNIDITKYPEFRNLPKDKTDFSCRHQEKTYSRRTNHSHTDNTKSKIIGCRTIASGLIRKCENCLRAPYLSKSCTDRIWHYTQVGPLMDQYFYEVVHS